MKKELNIEALRASFNKFLDNLTVEEVESWIVEDKAIQEALKEYASRESTEKAERDKVIKYTEENILHLPDDTVVIDDGMKITAGAFKRLIKYIES